MIKIAFVIDTIESPTAGTEKQLLMLIKHLDRTRFQPFLCVLHSSQWLNEIFVDCELIDIGFISFARPSSYAALLRFSHWLRKQRIDIVQTHFVDGNKVGILASKMAGVKVVLSTRRNQGYWHNRLELLMLSIFNKWVTCFLANSESTRQWVTKVEGINPRRIRVIYNGLETCKFYRNTDAGRLLFRSQLGFPIDSVVIGVVANLRAVKALDIFVKAAKMVSAHSSRARFIIVGDGPERAALENLSNELNMGPLICFLGKRLDIAEILSCIDIGILSSSSESFSNSIAEYMAAGLAVVSTDAGGAREAVEDGVTGYIVEPGDVSGMAQRQNSMIANNAYLGMGLKGREKALSIFSHKDIVNRYQMLYEEIR